MCIACGVAIVFCFCTVGDNEYLCIVIKTCASPKRVALIAIYLVKSLLDGDASFLQLYVHQWQTIYEDGYIIAGVVCTLFFLKLVQHLEFIVPMNVLAVYDTYVSVNTIIHW